MKIYVLPVDKEFQNPIMPVVYPAHNKGFKDGEEVFLEWIQRNPELLTTNPKEADWHYLPIFWTHWMVSRSFGKRDLPLLQKEVTRRILDDSKTFTIHEYAEQPKVNVGRTVCFLGSRTAQTGYDIPLLCAPHARVPNEGKRWYASFVGSLTTHPIRKELKEKFKNFTTVLISESQGTHFFVRTMLESYLALCPRGYGGASYRFYEAMQLGIVPVLIGDIDHRPFQNFLDWSKVSFYVRNVEEVAGLLYTRTEKEVIPMSLKVEEFYQTNLANGNWCKYVLKELEEI